RRSAGAGASPSVVRAEPAGGLFPFRLVALVMVMALILLYCGRFRGETGGLKTVAAGRPRPAPWDADGRGTHGQSGPILGWRPRRGRVSCPRGRTAGYSPYSRELYAGRPGAVRAKSRRTRTPRATPGRAPLLRPPTPIAYFMQ